jgi:cytoskeletal protein CcmA (bactofilin family)
MSTPAPTPVQVSAPTSVHSSTAISVEDRIAERYGKLRSALGSGTVIQGKLSFDTTVRIDGKLSGEIFSSKALIVGTSGTIDAQIQVASLVVMGTVKGKVKASERIELLAGGKIEGEISSPIFIMEEGAQLVGGCTFAGKSPAEGSDRRNEKRATNNEPSAATQSYGSREARV